MKSPSTLRHRAAVAAAVVVRAMAPATGVVAHQAVARVAPAEKTHHQTRPMDKSHLMQVLMPVRQAARARKVV